MHEGRLGLALRHEVVGSALGMPQAWGERAGALEAVEASESAAAVAVAGRLVGELLEAALGVQ